jgi:putative ABC transport system permease protein
MANLMTMKLIGATDLNNLPDFGTDRHIIDGRMFAGIDEVIISQDLAAHNGVGVGDTITIESVFHPVHVFELTVVGIYSDATPEYTDWWMQMFGRFSENRRNEIMTSFETITAAGFTDDRALHVRAEYFLRNPDYLPLFEAEVRALGLPDIFGVTINQDALDVVTGPLNSMSSTAHVFTVIVLLLGAIVLTLISYMAIRERKYEIGVLRAMGMGKSKISAGIFMETAAITAICLVIGLGVGNLAAQPVADMLLAGEVAAAEAAVNTDDGGLFLMAGGQAQTNNPAAGFSPISDIEIAIGTDVITQIILIAFGLAIISSIIAIATITKYEPMRILSSRA